VSENLSSWPSWVVEMLPGLWMSVQLVVTTVAIGAPLGLLLALLLRSRVSVVRLAIVVIVEIGRGIPALIGLAIAPAAKLDGLQMGRAATPTGKLIFQTLAPLRLIPANADQPATIPKPGPLQARLLELLDVDPTTTMIHKTGLSPGQPTRPHVRNARLVSPVGAAVPHHSER
jgi:hypothetical protein